MVTVRPPVSALAGSLRRHAAGAERSRDQRRTALLRDPHLTGLDYVRVRPGEPRPGEPEKRGEGGRHWLVDLHFVPSVPGSGKRAVPEDLRPSDLVFTLDGEVDRRVRVERLEPTAEPNVVTAVVRGTGDAGDGDGRDASTPAVHGLSLDRSDLLQLDPLFTDALVRLDPGVATPWTMPSLEAGEAPPEAVPSDRLAKDYDSFRRMLSERMSFFMPTWVERNPSDLGVTVLEVLAYAGDYLSYEQDAVATEAYLDTARRRISVRRHCRLLDFYLAEGASARAFVQIQVAAEPGGGGDEVAELPTGTPLLTSAARAPGVVAPGSEEYVRALEGGSLVFQTLHPQRLVPGHDALEIHTWGADDFTLPAGATGAHLVGWWPDLRPGDVLVFEKRQGYRESVAGAREGLTGDVDVVVADPRERHAVRLTEVPVERHDPLTRNDLTEISWSVDDALPRDFPVARAEGAVRHRGLTRVRGNVALANHGRSYAEVLAAVSPDYPYRPRLSRSGLTFHRPYGRGEARQPAAWALSGRGYGAETFGGDSRPDIELYELPSHLGVTTAEQVRHLDLAALPRWRPRLDLLSSGRFGRHFVVEVDGDGWPHLRFGDGANGRRPTPGTRFLARYRVGVGPQGNVGPHSIRHVVLPADEQLRLSLAGVEVRGAINHLPAAGGCEPTPMDYARIYAPDRIHTQSFQERLVTDGDGVDLARRHPEVLDAAARQVWTGSGHAVELFVLPASSVELSPGLVERLEDYLRPRLLLGWGLSVRPPRWVPLDVAVKVWLQPGERVERVYQRLIGGAGGRLRPKGGYRFGQPVYASFLTSRLLEVPGVADVRLLEFKRWGRPPAGELEAGVIPIGPLQVARLENDPAAPQRGTLRVEFAYLGEGGGR